MHLELNIIKTFSSQAVTFPPESFPTEQQDGRDGKEKEYYNRDADD